MGKDTSEPDHDIIRKSTDSDLDHIHLWLKEEDAAGVEDNFLCNWEHIKCGHEDGKLLVYVHGPTGAILGFQLGNLLAPGILQVRMNMRRRGIGRKLVEHRIEEARRKNEPLLRIECKPASSIPFWRRLGFNLYESGDAKNRAYLVLEWRHELPVEGQSIHVEISFYPERRKWIELTPAYINVVPNARLTSDRVIHFSERISFFKYVRPDVGDTVIEIIVEGVRRYLDKAKYESAMNIGVRRCVNGFYLDSILLTGE